MSKQALVRKTLVLAAVLGGIWLFLWVFGPVLLPFVLGYLAARAAFPAISVLRQRTSLPRWLSGGLCVALLYAGLGAILWALGLILCDQLSSFASGLPALASALTAPAARLEARLLMLARRFPDGVGLALESSIRSFFRTGAGLPDRVYQWIFDAVSSLVRRLPQLALFLMTAILSSFLLASRMPDLQALWQQKAPQAWQQRLRSCLDKLKATFGGWVHTQLILMGINFLVLTAGLWLLGLDFALLFGLLIALVDALPVFGSGFVLLPWGILQLVRGQTVQGVGLLCLYGGISLLRTSLEPRLLGKQMGLSPLLTLFSLYAGFRLFGVLGMILMPMAVMLGKQFWESGKTN